MWSLPRNGDRCRARCIPGLRSVTRETHKLKLNYLRQHIRDLIHYVPPSNIFLKSSCALPRTGALSPEGVCDFVPGAAGALAVGAGAGFRARPKPARGLDGALRGMNIPPADAGALRAFVGASSPSENRSRAPLNSRGSVCRSSRAASPADWNSTTASRLSTITSRRFTGASFSTTCWSRPSSAPSGRSRMRSVRLRTSAFLPNPVSGSLDQTLVRVNHMAAMGSRTVFWSAHGCRITSLRFCAS